jgi:hypothetical protein
MMTSGARASGIVLLALYVLGSTGILICAWFFSGRNPMNAVSRLSFVIALPAPIMCMTLV